LFYARIKTFIENYTPPPNRGHLTRNEIQAFFRSIWIIGILGADRWYYWNLFFWALFRHPQQFPMAITLSIYGYHFRKVSRKAINRPIGSTKRL